ncbi:outer dynein arm-docking complex subunit 4-like isoform X2 [Lineus longissimus]|uniref:outer dynein arm-docking complex subunit 4-like isoform X2 n=1 Tax=Lineus longissimus TaxID=88925 RepID=UPI002B4F54DA
MYDGQGSEAGPIGTFETYKAEGDTLFKQGEFRKAIESYTTALEIQPEDCNCLVSRSKCYLQLGDTTNALNDAESSLKDNAGFHKGQYQKAEAHYCMGQFEKALVYYHRGHKLRPELHEFRLGIQKAQEAIINSVGSPSKVKLTKEGDMSFFKKMDEKAKPKKTYGYNKPVAKQNTQVRREVPVRSQGSEKTIKTLLGEMYGDKVYLEKLLKETDPMSKSGGVIYDLVSEGLQYLDTRTEFWRQQKPMYARKRERKEQRNQQKHKKGSPNQYVIDELEKIDEAQANGKFDDSLNRAQRCLKTVEGWPENTIPNKPDVLANLHGCMGNAHIELRNYTKALNHHNKDLELAEENGLEDARGRALDNIGRVHARCGEYQKAITVWEKKKPLTKTPLEQTWLYHEIGRCHLELGNFTEAREYGEQSMGAAGEAKDDVWNLNACVLIAQSEVKLQEYQHALESFEKALELARSQRDDGAESAIKRAIDDVNNKLLKEIKDKEGGVSEEQEEEAEEKAKTPEPEPVREPTPEPVREPTPEPVREPSPEVVEEKPVGAKQEEEEEVAEEVDDESDKKSVKSLSSKSSTVSSSPTPRSKKSEDD